MRRGRSPSGVRNRTAPLPGLAGARRGVRASSSGGDARQASSSSSCAAKYSPARMSATPALYADSNFSVLHLHVVGAQLDRQIELVLARPHVVLPAVPGTSEHAPFEHAFAERALEVEAVLLHCVEAAGAVGQGDLLFACLDGADRSGRYLLDARDGHEPLFGHQADPSNG